jgi:apolipoprotein D and lipocalin family protein
MKNLVFLPFLFALFGCSTKGLPLETVKEVDLSRYAGKWYEIASFPQKFQKGCSCTSATYTPQPKGFVRVYNYCKKGDKESTIQGKAFVVKGSGNAKLKVQFFWPFRGDYWIIDLAEDYSHAMVGAPNRDYLWILSRTPEMDPIRYQEVLEVATEKKFDISRLQLTDQSCGN